MSFEILANDTIHERLTLAERSRLASLLPPRPSTVAHARHLLAGALRGAARHLDPSFVLADPQPAEPRLLIARSR